MIHSWIPRAAGPFPFLHFFAFSPSAQGRGTCSRDDIPRAKGQDLGTTFKQRQEDSPPREGVQTTERRARPREGGLRALPRHSAATADALKSLRHSIVLDLQQVNWIGVPVAGSGRLLLFS